MRRVLENTKYQLVYGKDVLFGGFIEVYKVNSDDAIVNWKGISLQKIVAIADDYGFDISGELDEPIIAIDA